MRPSLQDARRRLAQAAESLDAFRLAGLLVPQAGLDAAPAVPPEEQNGSRAVLRATLERLREVTAELEAAQARCQVVDEENKAMREASSARQEKARLAAREEREKEELEARLFSQIERSTLLQAECVRLDALRRQAAQSVAAVESDRRAVEGALRRELQSGRAEAARVQEAVESLKRDLAKAEAEASRVRELKEALCASRQREAELSEKLSALEAAAVDVPGAESGGESFFQPSIEPILDPGWSRLLRLVRPPVEAAYAHLRRLSSSPLSAGHRALVRLSAASIAQAADALSSVELVLEEAPPPDPPASIQGVLDSSLGAWEPSFRRQGVLLVRETHSPLPAAAHEPKALRVVLYHLLRNSLEALPRGGKLTVRSSRAPDGGLRLEFRDDGPGYPAAWLERRFQPFAAPRRGRAGLGLALVRKTLRRWGGEAEASNGVGGRGAVLVLSFAPPSSEPSPPGEAAG